MEEACISTWILYNIVNVHTMYIMCNTFQINLFLQRKATHEFSTKRLGVFEKRGQKYQKVCLTANIFMNVKAITELEQACICTWIVQILQDVCTIYINNHTDSLWSEKNKPKCYHECKKFKTELEEVCICTWNCTIL